MSWFSDERAGLRPAHQALLRVPQHSVICAHWALFAAMTLLCCGLLAQVLSREVADDAHATVALAVSAYVGMTLSARRREESTPVGPPIDPSVPCASYSRFSSDMQRDESNSDQQRKCREKAERNGHVISPDLEFADEAVSGTKLHRKGLDAMLAAARSGKFKVLYLYSLSRLSRESVITLPLLKDLVHNCGVRVISVTEGIDSNDTAWELIAHIMSIVHEQYLRDLAANVARGQEGALIAGFSVGDYCFGFTSVPIPGSELGRRGRDAKPRKIYVVDPETAPWVARIFHWFVHERQSLRWIARELNRQGAPKDHRATTKEWRHQYLTRLLKNQKYIGEWDWGKKRNVRDPLTGKVRQEDRAPEEYEQWLRHLPHLQIVDDETFAEAQRLLEINREAAVGSRQKKGRLNGSEAGTSHVNPRHLLSGLIVCGHCGRTLHVGGTNGRYLFCPGYRMGTCSCQTQLRRDRAERMILGEIGRRILADPAWRQRVLEETLKAWNAQEATIPTELAAARRNLVDVEQKIANLVDHIENGRGGPELDERLAQRRAEKRELTERVKRLEAADQNRRPKPTEAWVDEQLRQLGDALSNGSPAAAHALRDLVGGQIVVTEVRQPGRERHYLQGRFTITSMAVVAGLIGTAEVSADDSKPASDALAEDIVIDFRKAPAIEAQSERAKELYDQGMMNAQIAQSLGCSRSRVTALLKFWFESRGLEMPDGRTRRATLKQKHVAPPLYQEIADDVMALWRQKMLLQDIADRLQIDRNTVTSAVRWWHGVRNLPVPDGRTRRKELDQKTSPKSKESDEELPAQPPEDKLGHEPDEGKDKH